MTELRRCPFCKTTNTIQIHDCAKSRAYECLTCMAVEKITKTENSGWWYHGWQQLDTDGEPGLRCDGDGTTKQAPISFAKWAAGLDTSA